MANLAIRSFIHQLTKHTILTEAEQEALWGLPATDGGIHRNETIIQREAVVKNSCIVVQGLVARANHSEEGGRQITSFYVPGDMPDLHTLMRPRATFSLHAICESEILLIPHVALRNVMKTFPAVTEAFCREMVRASDLAAEWVVNVGMRPAKQRLAHIFCEMAVKTGMAQDVDAQFSFPVTQTTLAEATGLSTVHVNRSIQSLRKEELLRFEQGEVYIPNWQALVKAAGFDSAYLEDEGPRRFTN
jgi:CRP-like cAMP-binding protein